MTSVRHEGLVSLFQHRPELAPELLRDVLGVELPTYTEARIDSSNLTEVVPIERFDHSKDCCRTWVDWFAHEPGEGLDGC